MSLLVPFRVSPINSTALVDMAQSGIVGSVYHFSGAQGFNIREPEVRCPELPTSATFEIL